MRTNRHLKLHGAIIIFKSDQWPCISKIWILRPRKSLSQGQMETCSTPTSSQGKVMSKDLGCTSNRLNSKVPPEIQTLLHSWIGWQLRMTDHQLTQTNLTDTWEVRVSIDLWVPFQVQETKTWSPTSSNQAKLPPRIIPLSSWETITPLSLTRSVS